jgi:hypothetical protein
MDKKLCEGCTEDFYNGNNQLGVQECWMLKDAKLEERMPVHIDQPPPYRWTGRRLPSCYRMKKHVIISKDALTKDGYWRT